MAEIYVLDTSAWLALNEGEPGADQVEAIIASAWLDDLEIHCSFVTLAELEIIRTRETSPAAAAELIGMGQRAADSLASFRHRHLRHSSEAQSREQTLIRRLLYRRPRCPTQRYPRPQRPEMAALGDKVKQHILPLKTRIP